MEATPMRPSPESPNDGEEVRPNAVVARRKRRRLQFVKCENCRKDKQKCLPVEREWPQKCDRCVDKGFPCSEGKRVCKTSTRLGDTEKTTRSGKSKPSYQLFGLDVEDWAFLLNYRTIISRAMNRLQKLKDDINRLFKNHTAIPTEEVDEEAAFLAFEKFFANLDSIVLKGAEKMFGTSQLREHPAVFSALMGQVLNVHHRPPFVLKTSIQASEVKSGIHSQTMKTGDPSSQLLASESHLTMYGPCLYHWYDGCEMLWPECEPIPLKGISDSVHVKAKGTLTKLDIWGGMPEVSRGYASFLPEEFIEWRNPLELSEDLTTPLDCLGQNLLSRCVDDLSDLEALDVLHEMREDLGEKEAREELSRQDILGRSLLHIACQKGYSTIVDLLLKLGARPDISTVTGAVPLHYAAAIGSSKLCKRLLYVADELEMNVADITDNLGHTALYYAVANKHVDATVTMLKSGLFNPNRTDSSDPPLAAAIRSHNEQIVSALLDSGADPNQRSGDKTLFQLALEGKILGIVRLLAMHLMLDVNKADEYGQTPIFKAARFDWRQPLTILLSRNDVDVNVQDRNGNTPLMRAIADRSNSCAEVLLHSPKADLFLQNSEGQTAAELARSLRLEHIAVMIESEITRRDVASVATQGWIAAGQQEPLPSNSEGRGPSMMGNMMVGSLAGLM